MNYQQLLTQVHNAYKKPVIHGNSFILVCNDEDHVREWYSCQNVDSQSLRIATLLSKSMPMLSTGNENPNDFCGCCDDSVFTLAQKTLEDQLKGAPNQAMKEVLQANSIDDLGPKGKHLVDWCVDFLLFLKHNNNLNFEKKNRDQVHPFKYITIWSFIYSFLGIPENSGYDYWLLSFLQWNGLMEHGPGIRCGWLKVNNTDRKLTEERKQAIITWAENCPDDI